MTDDGLEALSAAFTTLRAQGAVAGQLATEVTAPPPPHLKTWPPPLPPRPGRNDGREGGPRPEPITEEQVALGWETSRHAWVNRLRRRELVAAMRLLGRPWGTGRLVDLDGLADALATAASNHLRGARFVDAVGSVWFLRYPPPPGITAQLERAQAEVDVSILPRWLREIGANATGVVRLVGPRFRQAAAETARDEWQLPATLTDGPWVDAIVRVERPTSVEDVERLLRLADHGIDLRAPAALTDSVRHVVRNAVECGRRDPAQRRRIVGSLRGRVGDLFGELGRPRWAGLEDELRTLRSWVAGEFMDVIFQHVRPDGMFSHQLEPRRTFWRKYGGAVERLTVYVKGGRAQLMALPDVARIVRELEGMVRIGTLESPTAGHAILVMEMTGTGGLVTVAEGNSSAKVRIRTGAVSLSPNRISYRDDITSAYWNLERMHDEPGHWKGIVRAELSRYGIRETS